MKVQNIGKERLNWCAWRSVKSVAIKVRSCDLVGIYNPSLFFLYSRFGFIGSSFSYSSWIQWRSGAIQWTSPSSCLSHSSCDSQTCHNSALFTIFTPGGSLGSDTHLVSGSDLSTVTQDKPKLGCFSVDEVMRLDSQSCYQTELRMQLCWERLYGSDALWVANMFIVELFNSIGLKSMRTRCGILTHVIKILRR